MLTGTGEITAVLSDVESSLGKRTGAELPVHTEPEPLIAKLMERYKSGNYKCPCQPSRCHCEPVA